MTRSPGPNSRNPEIPNVLCAVQRSFEVNIIWEIAIYWTFSVE
jgi:hypothetical protein